MKNCIAVGLLALISVAQAQAGDCTDKIVVSAEGSTIIKLGPVAAKDIFAAANSVQLGGTMDLATRVWTNTIQSEKMICCKFSSPVAFIVDSERCEIAIAADGSLADINASMLK